MRRVGRGVRRVGQGDEEGGEGGEKGGKGGEEGWGGGGKQETAKKYKQILMVLWSDFEGMNASRIP